MRFVIQVVDQASVSVDNRIVGSIEKGYLVLIGIGAGDTPAQADKLVRKMMGLRIFQDANGKTNLSLGDVGGALLLVSQFTLYANCKKGNRPSFTESAPPDLARELYEHICDLCRSQAHVETGIFGADMKVSLINDGPFTVILDSDTL